MNLTRRALLSSSATASLALAGRLAGLAHRPHSGSAGLDPAADLLAAAGAGDLARVRSLLEAEPGLVAARDAAGRSAFVLAHLGGHGEVAEALRAGGAPLDLVESVLARDWQRVEAAGAEELDRLHPIGGTAFYAGARCGTPELYRLRALGADPNLAPVGGSGFTPARAAMDVADPTAAFVTATDVLGNRGRAHDAQRGGDSVLHGAVRRRDERLVRLAVRKGAAVDARDAEGRTPVELAEALGWEPGVALLAAHEQIARDHTTSRWAWNASRERVAPLALDDVPRERQNETTGKSHFALDRVRALLGEDPRLIWSISGDGELAIEACGHTGNRAIIHLHLEHGAPLSLPTALSLGDLDHARFLLDEDPLRVHERGPHDFPVLWYAAIGGDDPAAAELLLERGCPLEQESLGNTCLHWAAFRGRPELIRFLAERGADLDAVGYKWDRAGQTPLALALASGREEAAAALRELGAHASAPAVRGT